MTGRQAYNSDALHRRYGEYVRVAPNELSVITAAAWKDIYDFRVDGRRGFPKDTKNFCGRKVAGVGVPSILTADDVAHSRVRRVFSHAFSNRALAEQEELLRTYADQFIKRLVAASRDSKVDLVRFFNFLTFDTIAHLTFGEPLHLLDSVDYDPWIENLFTSAKFVAISSAIRNIPIIRMAWWYLIPKSIMVQQTRNVAFCRERVDRRLAASSSKHPDFWSFVFRAEGKEALSTREMYANSLTFMVAGTETTATSLSGLLYHLLHNATKMNRLVNEIRSAFHSPDEMTMLNLPRLDYLQACIEEALRIYPPVAAGLPRIVPTGGGQTAGNPLPPGVRTAIQSSSLIRLIRS